MNIFVTGASGYIGGSVAAALIAAGHAVSGLARSAQSAEALEARGIAPVRGTLDDRDILAAAARAADVTVNAAHAGHRGAAEALLGALAGSGKTLVHTSGSSIVGTRAGGELVEGVFDEDTTFTPTPQRAERVAIDNAVRAAAQKGVRAIVICPSLIYGRGRGLKAESMQVPWLIALARKSGVAKHIGSGANRWSNVHIDDLVRLYAAAIGHAPAGAFYFAENGESSMRELCEAISRMLGFGGRTQTMTVAEAAAEWGEGAANDTMGANSRVRARRARAELGWTPTGAPLIEEIERGCYAEDEGRL
jgi:nucleoside-diphosphate-sugar epimerase